MKPSFLWQEVWTGLRRSLSMAVSIMLVSMVSFVFLGVGLLSNRQVEAAKGYWYDKVEVSIFMCTARSSEPNCRKGAFTQSDQAAVAALLDSMKPTVAGYEFETQDQAYERFKEQFKNNPTFAETPKEAIPAAYRVKLSDPSDFQTVHDAFTGMPGVATVKDIRQVLNPLFAVLDFLKRAAWVLAAVMLFCTVLLISTTIRQVAWSRRRETGIKRVVGASKLSIQLPFFLETMLAVGVGTLGAIGVLWGLVRFGVQMLADRFRDFAWVTPVDVWAISPVLVLVAVVVTVVVSWGALAKHVRV